MFFSVKNMIFQSSSLQTLTQTLTPSYPPPTTTGGHHKPPLLVVGSPHEEEHFNQRGILKIHLKDLIEKQALNPFFHNISEVSLTSMFFS